MSNETPEKKETAHERFLKEREKAIQTKRSVLTAGAVEPIHLNRRVHLEMEPAWDNVQDKPATFPATPHTHDDRYYTEDEVDAFFEGYTAGGKAKVDWASLTSVPLTFAPSAHALVAIGHTVSGLTPGDVLKALTGTTFGFAALALDDLSDVNAPSPSDADALIWDAGTSKWIAAPVGAGSLALDDLSDVNAPTPNDGDNVTWDAGTSKWVAAAPGVASLGLDDLSDVNAPAPDDEDYLIWDAGAGEWVNSPLLAHGHAWDDIDKTGSILDDIADVNLSAIATGAMLYRSASAEWINLPFVAGTTPRNNYVKQAISGTIPTVAGIEEGDVSFYDSFGDASIHWAWQIVNTTAAKTITESGGVLTIVVNAGTAAAWSASACSVPAAVIGVPGTPCEIIVKMVGYTMNDDSAIGIALARTATWYSSGHGMMLVRWRDDSAPAFNGVTMAIPGSASVYSAAGITNDPIWLKIQLSNEVTTGGHRIDGYYSTDGISWTLVGSYTAAGISAAGSFCVKLFGVNWGANNAINVPFDDFKIIRSLGPG